MRMESVQTAPGSPANPDPPTECEFGRCDPAHPLHCCHWAVGEQIPAGRRGQFLCSWRCIVCELTSKSAVLVFLRGGVRR